MNLKPFIRNVLSLKPTMSVSDGYFFYRPVEYIVSGFTLDARPSGGQIFAFAMPLFDRIDHISLTFSERLPHPQCNIELEGGARQLAKEFVHRISPYEGEVQQWSSIDTFAQRTGAESVALQNPRVRRGYGLALVMQRRDSEALKQLEAAIEVDVTARYPGFRQDVSLVIGAIKSGGDTARELLLKWVDETKKRLSIAA